MQNYSRREFLRTALSGAGVLAATPGLVQAGDPSAPATSRATDIVALGHTGVKASRLAQGTGMNGWARQSDHTRLGEKGFDELVRFSLDQGVNFLDMADLYGTHPFVRNVIKGLPREKLVLLSKIWVRKEDWVTPSGGAVAEVDRFRKELGVDTIDICLIHCMTDAKWAEVHERVRDDLSALKQKGAVRAVGVSCHDFGALKLAATHPWVDVIFARINNKGGTDYSMDGSAEDVGNVLKLARSNGKAVVGMKIFGAGKLVAPDEKDASLRYVFDNKLVDAITIGMLKKEHVSDAINRINVALKA